jgi:hypothetical protein
MRKKMKKYQPGGQEGMGTRNQPNPVQPVAPVMKTPPNSAPVNANQPQAPQAPVTPITSSATAQAPAMDPLLAANEKYTKLGYNPRKARRMAMKEVNPMNKQKVSGADVLNTISGGLDLVNKSSGAIGAVRSAFQKNGGQMGGKQLRKTSAFMPDGGSGSGSKKKVARKATRAAKNYDKAATAYSKGNMAKGDRKMAKADKLAVAKKGGSIARKANRAVKKYVGAEKAYTSGNMKKGARKEAKGDKIAAKINKLQTAKRGGTKTRKR